MGAEQRLNRRDVGDSWAGWAIAMLSQVLSDQLKPYVNQGRGGGGGAYYALHITTGPPDFQTFLRL